MILFISGMHLCREGWRMLIKRLNIEYEVYYDCARDWDSDNEFADRFRKELQLVYTML